MKQIIAMGGGGFSMEPDNLSLDQYILNQSKREQPRICFLADGERRFPKLYSAVLSCISNIGLRAVSFIFV
ncbi:hypothetical protein BsubNA05_31120 [Bacillus subtilis]|nr:hypothetical protein BsubNA05_31120 [Bacillus subtilis]